MGETLNLSVFPLLRLALPNFITVACFILKLCRKIISFVVKLLQFWVLLLTFDLWPHFRGQRMIFMALLKNLIIQNWYAQTIAMATTHIGKNNCYVALSFRPKFENWVGRIGIFFFFFLRTVMVELKFSAIVFGVGGVIVAMGNNIFGRKCSLKRIYKSCKCFFKPIVIQILANSSPKSDIKKKEKKETLFFRILRSSVGMSNHTSGTIISFSFGFCSMYPFDTGICHPRTSFLKYHFWRCVFGSGLMTSLTS